MKTNLEPENEDRLDAVLQEWVVDAALPPRFQEHVWNRIAHAEDNSQLSIWSGMVRWMTRAFERPKVAYSYAVALLAFGIVAGSWTAEIRSNRLEHSLGQQYLQSVDPYRQAASSP
jgi:hypothetical protein